MSGDYEVIDPRFADYVLGNCRVERLFNGTLWAEGPCYFADGDYLVWSDIPNDRMLKWVPELGVTVYRHPANYTNGHTRDREGRLVSCEHGARRVTRTEWDGSITVLADAFEGKRLNSPNDVVVKSDGTVWFTDPPYGILSDYEGHKANPEYGGCYVFRRDPDGSLNVASDDFVKPNGLCFSPDESRLYIADTGASHDPNGPRHIRVFDVGADNALTGGAVFATCDAGLFDGFRCDTDGNVWSSAGDGVHCYTPDGTLLGKVLVPEAVANVVFGGAKRNRLFIAATTSLYAVFLNRTGAQWP